jgi:magnesium transporter
MVQQEQMENLRDKVRDLVEAGDVMTALELMSQRHAADQADVIENLEPEIRSALIEEMEYERLADILEYVHEELRADLLADWTPAEIARALDEVDEDLAADIVQDLPREQADEVIPLLEYSDEVSELLSFPEGSAGGRMSPDFVALRRDWTVDGAIQFLRKEQPNADQPFYLYVVDEDQRLTGIVGLRDLVTAAPETPIAAILRETPINVRTTEDQEVAAERMRHYNLLALPVIDEGRRLRGVITADDILDVQVEEATEDMFRMAGVGVDEWAFSPVFESARRRIPWLSFNMVWAFAGAGVISLFSGTIERVAALAIFMPMIAGQAGNAGIQTATIMIRSLALGEVHPSDIFRVLRKEWCLGLIKGSVFGSMLGLVAWISQGNVYFGVIAGTAMFLNMFVASTTGVVLPITLRRFGFDPATIAGVFDTMLTDLMGFVIYLGLATIFVTKLS